MNNNQASVSIIIPTLLKDPQLLNQCLASLSNITFSGTLEVIVVVNRPIQASDIIKIQRLNIKWISLQDNLGFAAAVNSGIQVAQGDFIVCLNDDVTVSSKWLDELISEQLSSGADMIASNIYLADGRTLDSQGFTFAWRGKAEAIKQGKSYLQQLPDYWLNNVNLFSIKDSNFWKEPFGPDAAACLYTKILFDDIGVFREDYIAYLEDVELALRARRSGYRCSFAEGAIVYHHKHATSSTMGNFKVRRDLINWWKTVLTYKTTVWLTYLPAILLERFRNLSGFLKCLL